MSQLIQALQIFLKYGDKKYPTHCEHDEMIVDIDPADVSEEDKAKLEDLGFIANDAESYFYSYHFGSC